MLSALAIRDLAVVERIDLCFQQGLTVLTGETGAGKSLLLTALGLALGDRADAGSVRAGAGGAEVVAEFALDDAPQASDWLKAQALDADGACLIRRVLTPDGRSRAFINGSPVTLTALQELGPLLLEIHGQHAHINLTKPKEQQRLLDEAAHNRPILEALAEAVEAYRRLAHQLEARRAESEGREQRLSVLAAELSEMESLAITEFDYSALSEAHERQANATRILEIGQRELSRWVEGEDRPLLGQLTQSIRSLSELADWGEGFREVQGLLEEAEVALKEASQRLRRELERQDTDPALLEAIETRLAAIHRLSRKHQVRPERLNEHYEALKSEYTELGGGEETLDALEKALEARETLCRDLAQKLSDRRLACATQLAERVGRLARSLGMARLEVEWAVEPKPQTMPGANGWDVIEIRISPNPGMAPGPLARIASGGELSRIGLAIQVALTGIKTVPTLIFDEVDSGVGGGIAAVVGSQLRLLGATRQVFSVTHLPQVAAQGHQHLRVQKVQTKSLTQTEVITLEGDARVEEIARMLGGAVLTAAARAHALEMLDMAHAKADLAPAVETTLTGGSC